MTARRLLLALASFAIACTQAHEVTAIDPCADLDPDGWECARAWVATLDRDHCRYYRECRGISLSEELCDAYYPEAGAWEAIYADDHRLALEEGRLRFDPEGLRCLLDRRSRCETEWPTTPCPPEWVATREHAEGDACDDAYECGEGMVCAGAERRCGELLGTCRRVPGLGEPCDVGCGGGLLTCADGRCERVVGRDATGISGDPCNVVTREDDGRWLQRDCAEGFGCTLENVCAASPRCGEQLCEDFHECSAESTCEPIPTPREGDACRTASQCAWGTFAFTCNAATRTCERTERLMGDTCDPGWTPCVEGVCTADDEESNSFHCTAPAPAGAPCWYDRQCASHACCDHQCG